MYVYFDTVKRKRPVREGGELVKVDWSAKKVIKQVPLYPTDPDIIDDPNPRGNSRGGKGMLVSGDEIFVGTYHSILVYDIHLNLKYRITNNLFSNIHEMSFAGEHIWVSSTTIDCALQVDREGKTLKTWWPREERLLQEKYGFFPMEIDKQADNRLVYLHAELENSECHTHLNSVATFSDRTYVLLNKQGVLVKIEPEMRIEIEDRNLRGAHSPTITPCGNRLILCGSFKKTILIYDLETGELNQKIELMELPEIANLHRDYPDQPFNRSIFVRGLEIIDDHRVLVGVSPAAILEIDINNGKLLDLFQYSQDVGDAVHGLVHWKE